MCIRDRVYSIPKLLKSADLKLEDIDLWELNEAFASQVVYIRDKLGLPSDKLNVAGIGVGGMGRNNLSNIKNQNIVALCDVDWTYAKRCFDDYPGIKKFKDYRVMLDKMENQIDAVVIATPDHTHYVSAADSIRRGMHVYVQKPLTHSVWESRELTKLAKETGVATQMGNQGNSSLSLIHI